MAERKIKMQNDDSKFKTADKKEVGGRGENLACGFLKKHGYKILKRNYRTKAGEIDIIARDSKSLLFVEVKTRSDSSFGYPEMNVHPKKLRSFQTSVQLYILENKIREPFRLDVISIDLSQDPPEIRHFENITM